MIEAKELTKEFLIPVKQPGMRGAIRQLIHGEYQRKVAVDHVNLKVEQGEAVAYIGPNGAGKSTTIKMLTGILKPSSGEILINGRDPQKNRIQNAKNIGVVFGQRSQLWWDIPVEESFLLLKNIYEISDKVYRENLKLFNDIFGLQEFVGRTARKLSLGQRMKADLAAALLHNPSIVFLDEPTIGLDIGTKEAMRELIQLGVVYTNGKNTRKEYKRLEKEKYWSVGKEYLRSPVKNAIWINQKKIDEAYAGDSALEHLTMMNAAEYKVYAVDKRNIDKYISNEIPEQSQNCCKVEIWNYDPRLFADENNNVDIISLYSSFMNFDDERVHIELEELMEEYLNDRIREV